MAPMPISKIRSDVLECYSASLVYSFGFFFSMAFCLISLPMPDVFLLSALGSAIKLRAYLFIFEMVIGKRCGFPARRPIRWERYPADVIFLSGLFQPLGARIVLSDPSSMWELPSMEWRAKAGSGGLEGKLCRWHEEREKQQKTMPKRRSTSRLLLPGLPKRRSEAQYYRPQRETKRLNLLPR